MDADSSRPRLNKSPSNNEKGETVIINNPDQSLRAVAWARKALTKATGLAKREWWKAKPKSPEAVSEPALEPVEVEPEIVDIPVVDEGAAPDILLYQAPEEQGKERKRRSVRFDISPKLKEQFTRVGRKTKIPARFQD